jgi:hypothetical protein
MKNPEFPNRDQDPNVPLWGTNFEFRRQFLLGPIEFETFPNWTRHPINSTHCLTAHPDLNVHQAGQDGKSITLIGYILDPEHPEYTDRDIVNSLLNTQGTFQSVLDSTSTLGGRWVLIVDNGIETILFTDAGGQRQLYYSVPDSPLNAKIYCASNPSQMADALHLDLDHEALDFLHSCTPSRYGAYWLPGDSSLYECIKLLLPNHYLNLHTGEIHRYWPNQDLVPIDPQQAIVESALLMRGMMAAARHRFNLALSMTAGWDSRIMLALSRDFLRDLFIYTMNFNPHFKVPTNDVLVPATLLKKLGGSHHIINYATKVNPKFEAIYNKNNESSHRPRCGEAQALYEHFPQERVCITGDVAEIVKCHFRPPILMNRALSAQDLAIFDNRGKHPFLIRAYEKWLSGCHYRNTNPLDLFCWEHMVGRIQALIRAQNDLVQESFAPFNCRKLLVTMLSVDEAYRKSPEHKFLREMIVHLWSEVLSEPINPPDRRRIKNIIVDLFIKLNIYRFIPESIKTIGKRIFR